MQQLPLFDAVEIPLTKGYTALVDPCDADLAQHRWHAKKSGNQATYYAKRSHRENRKHYTVCMHRIILSRMLGRDLTSTEYVDHIDGNGLNNRRANLRMATRSENARNSRIQKSNTSGYKGVYYSHSAHKWTSHIRTNEKRLCLGFFNTPEEAHAAYCEAAKKYHGQFARTE